MIPSRVLLIGFMASGKTEVGSRLATRLNWQHIDLDAVIVERVGMSIGEIFSTRGEQSFRNLEKQLTHEVLHGEQVVVTPGGGWVTNAGILEGLPEGTLTIWLRVSPEEVLRRLERSIEPPVRPMLENVDRNARIRELLELREPLYRHAHITINTDGRPIDEVVDLIEDAMDRHERPSSTQSRENDQ